MSGKPRPGVRYVPPSYGAPGSPVLTILPLPKADPNPTPAGGHGLSEEDKRAMRRAYFETKGRLDLLPDDERLPGDKRTADPDTVALASEIERVQLEVARRHRVIR